MADNFADKMRMAGNVNTALIARRIAGLGMGSLGVGAAIAGVGGLMHLATRSFAPPPTLPSRRQRIVVAVPEKTAAGPYAAAAAAFGAVKAAQPRVPALSELPVGTETVARGLDTLGMLKDPNGANWSLPWDSIMNYGGRALADKPWAIPAATAAIVGGGYLGHKLTSMAVDKARNVEGDSELSTAKQRYESALMPKSAADATLLRVFDRILPDTLAPGDAVKFGYALADALLGSEKRAMTGLGPINTLMGAYLAAAGTIGVGSGVAAYNWAKSNSPDSQIEDALRARREQLFAAGPSPIMLVPQPQSQSQRPRPRPYPQLAKVGHAGTAASEMLNRMETKKQQMAQQVAAMFSTDKGKATTKPQATPTPVALPSVLNATAPTA